MKLLKDDIEMGIVTIKRWVTKGFTYSQIRGAVGRLLAGYIRLSTRKTLRYNRKLEKYLHRLITKWSVYSSNREVTDEMIEAFFRIDNKHPCKKAQGGYEMEDRKLVSGTNKLVEKIHNMPHRELRNAISEGEGVFQPDVYKLYLKEAQRRKIVLNNDNTYKLVRELFQLVKSGDYAEVKRLIDEGVDFNNQAMDGVTALMYSLDNGKIEVAKLLIEERVKVNTYDMDGRTALMIASQEGHTEIVKLLVAAGADVNIQNKNKYTALIIASLMGHTEVVKLLIAAGANVNAQTDAKYRALYFASESGYEEIVKVLLEEGADVNAKDLRGETALIAASGEGHTEVVKQLIEAGADVKVRVKGGISALTQARWRGHEDIANLLIDAGAKED